MPQIGLFPLSDEELKVKAKVLAGEIRLLAKTIETEKEERQASDEEAPWQARIDTAEAKVGCGRKRMRRALPTELVEGEIMEEP
jgi:FtsZ-binding cell division protein ZapB